MSGDADQIKTMLWAGQKWPGIYFFKFIVPNEKDKLEQVKRLFKFQEDITYRTSRDIRFIALSCKQEMKNPDEVLALYKTASEIDGVISL
jgi:hypothetical protein